MTRFVWLTLAGLLVGGCGGDDDSPTGPTAPADVSGAWTYNASNLTGTLDGDPASCSISGVSLVLGESDGSFNDGAIACVVDGEPFPPAALGNHDVPGLVVNGNTIAFIVDTFGGLDHDGSVNGNSMSGTVTMLEPVLGTFLSGNWSATR